MAESTDTVDTFFAGLDYEGAEEAPDAGSNATADTAPAASTGANAETSEAAAAATEAKKPDELVKPTDVKALEAKPDTVAPNLTRDYVPIAAHLEEKGERKRLSGEVDRLNRELAALKNPPAPKVEAPDFAQDPRGYVDHTVKAALDQLETGQKQATQTAQQAAAAAEHNSFLRALDHSQQQFAQTTPDYNAALDHLRLIRYNELTTLNPQLTKEAAADVIGREELQLASQLMRAGRNPAEVAYSLARARGYAPRQQQTQANTNQPPQAGNVSQLVPNVPQQKQLAPDLTLGSGTGTPGNAADAEGDDNDAFDSAFKEVFGRRRA